MSNIDQTYSITINYLRDSYRILFGKEIPRDIPICEFLEKEFNELYEIRTGYLFEINPMLWTNKAQNEMIKKYDTLKKEN